MLFVSIECHCSNHRFDSDKSLIIKIVFYLKDMCQFSGVTEDKSVKRGVNEKIKYPFHNATPPGTAIIVSLMNLKKKTNNHFIFKTNFSP